MSEKNWNDNIENSVPNEIEKKKINKSFWAFQEQPFNTQVLNLLRHGNHELSFSPMLKEKTQILIKLSVELEENLLTVLIWCKNHDFSHFYNLVTIFYIPYVTLLPDVRKPRNYQHPSSL